jgi:hypothetical protein
MNSLEEMDRRVARLERQNRLLVGACLVLGASPFILGAGQEIRINVDKAVIGQQGKVDLPSGATGVLSKDMRDTLKLSNAIQPIVKTKLLVLVDSKGKARATLSTDESSNPAVALYDETGKLRSKWSVDIYGGMIQMLNHLQQPDIRLGVKSGNILEMVGPAQIVGGSQNSNFFELTTRGENPKLEIDGPNGSSVILKGTRDQEISLGCERLGERNVFLKMNPGTDSPKISLSAGPISGGLDIKQPDSLFRAGISCWKDLGGNLYSRRKESDTTHQTFRAHADQGFSPTRSAHLREVSPDNP